MLSLCVARSKITPKKETFDFRLPSVAHKRLCLSSLLSSGRGGGGGGGLKTLGEGYTSFTHLYYPVIQATHCQINKDQSRTEGILFQEEDAPACFWRHQGTTAVAEALFPR